jgi:hypothetical protein
MSKQQDGRYFDFKEGMKCVMDDGVLFLAIDDDRRKPIVLDFLYGPRGGGTSRDVMRIKVTSVFGNEYEAFLTPDYDCERKEIEDSRYVSKHSKEGEEIVSHGGKDFDGMKKNAELVLRSREFKEGIRKMVEKGEMEKENFSDDMGLYLGIEDEDMKTIRKEFSRQSEENISNG